MNYRYFPSAIFSDSNDAKNEKNNKTYDVVMYTCWCLKSTSMEQMEFISYIMSPPRDNENRLQHSWTEVGFEVSDTALLHEPVLSVNSYSFYLRIFIVHCMYMSIVLCLSWVARKYAKISA